MKTSFLSQSIAGNITAGKRNRARYLAKVATRSCPKPERRYRNPRLMRKLRGAMRDAKRYYRKWGITVKKYYPKTERFTRYNRWTKTLVENVYLRLCYRKKFRSGTRCYYSRLRMFRTKPKGSSYWNQWKFDPRGGNKVEFNCSKM